MDLDMLALNLVHNSNPGTRRFRKIHDAVVSGMEKPPMDLRYLARCKFGRNKNPQVISDVISFLEQIYMSVAENLPDVRDDTFDDQRAMPDSNPLNLQLYEVEGDDPAKVTKTKKYQRGVPICPGRSVSEGCEERYLPAGTMKEYWIQYSNQVKSGPAASFATFWRAPQTDIHHMLWIGPRVWFFDYFHDPFEMWFSRKGPMIPGLMSFFSLVLCLCPFLNLWTETWSSHYSFMKFRSASSHAQCTECIKHKSMIAGLSHHLRARRVQQQMLYDHLQSQFRDRVCYWHLRGKSRARGLEICLIQDGMDQAKFQVPRHPMIRAKSLESFNRPKLHVAATICHGRHVALPFRAGRCKGFEYKLWDVDAFPERAQCNQKVLRSKRWSHSVLHPCRRWSKKLIDQHPRENVRFSEKTSDLRG